jgi:tetratricopeptide (TPR) repeat protein
MTKPTMQKRYVRAVPIISLLALATVISSTSPGRAQEGRLTAADRENAVHRIAELVTQRYVFKDIGIETAEHIRAQLTAGAFDDITGPEEFARVLTEELQSVNHDRHMRVRQRSTPAGDQGGPPDPIMMRIERLQGMQRSNFGFARVERLDGNVGYVDLRGFFPVDMARETAVAAMKLLAHSDAVIFDLRRNGGGNPNTIRLICSYFFDESTHLNSLYWREGDRTEEFWTLEEVEGERMADVPLFVLTSDYTFSGAEEFAYNLQTRNRATIVGETTGGGANPGGMAPVDEHFDIFIPTGRAINPVTGINWEGTGVQPDVRVPADEALERGLELARDAAEQFREQKQGVLDAEYQRLKDDLAAAEARADSELDSETLSGAVATALRRATDAGLLEEMAINSMGYRYLREGKIAMAIAAFLFNTEAYPMSSNVYDSLGEAYMEAGRKEEAIVNYRKSLKLDPGNNNAVRMLRRMGIEIGEE